MVLHALVQQILIEHLLCARHMLGAGGPGIVVEAVKGINLQMSVEL